MKKAPPTYSFTTPLVRITNPLPLMSDAPDEKLLVQHELLMTSESGVIYTTEVMTRIRKDNLLKPKKRYDGFFPEYEIYCLPQDVDKAAHLLHGAVKAELQKLADYFGSMSSSANAGLSLKSRAQVMEALFNKAKNKGRDDSGPFHVTGQMRNEKYF